MRRALAVVILLTMSIAATSHAGDGTSGVGPPVPIITGFPANPQHPNSSTVVINPIESVSISNSQVWPDNRHRAYFDFGTGNVNGFLLFDISSIPPGSSILSMHLLCSLENAYNSPYLDPLVEVYYSADDNWTRATATPGSLSLDALLAGPILFTTWVPTYDFGLNAGAHDWSADLADGRITLGFKNASSTYSYVYFFGAGDDPVGPAPSLTITYDGPTTTRSVTWGRIKTLFR